MRKCFRMEQRIFFDKENHSNLWELLTNDVVVFVVIITIKIQFSFHFRTKIAFDNVFDIIVRLNLIVRVLQLILTVNTSGRYESSRVSISLGNSDSRSRSKAFESLARLPKASNKKIKCRIVSQTMFYGALVLLRGGSGATRVKLRPFY